MRKPLATVSCADPPCGACCLHLDTPPFLSFEWPWPDEKEWCDPEVWGLFEEIRAIESKQTHQDENGGPCLWFDPVTRRCKHYDLRPVLCESFEVGGDDCLRFRREHGVGAADGVTRRRP